MFCHLTFFLLKTWSFRITVCDSNMATTNDFAKKCTNLLNICHRLWCCNIWSDCINLYLLGVHGCICHRLWCCNIWSDCFNLYLLGVHGFPAQNRLWVWNRTCIDAGQYLVTPASSYAVICQQTLTSLIFYSVWCITLSCVLWTYSMVFCSCCKICNVNVEKW